ncbi:MAG TPA: STAS domain-containing protein [Jiangellaceae bacterium]
MGQVDVVDRGGREIVVFLSGDITESDQNALDDAIDEVEALERLNGLNFAVVDMHNVTSIGPPGIAFLHRLQDRGDRTGFDVSFSAVSAPAHRALEAAGWEFIEHSPPRSTM